MRIAIVGSGISGLGAAWMLHKSHEIVLYEAEPRLGGHSNTIDLDYDGESIPVDTGFIVYNDINYPNLRTLFAELDVATCQSSMSFAVSANGGSVEWAGENLNTVFAQRRNLFRPSFLRMTLEILRFNRTAPLDLNQGKLDGRPLGEYLFEGKYSDAFKRHYLLPMGGAIWSTSLDGMLDFPAESFVSFCVNHFLLSRDRPRWRTVSGGSREYVRRIANLFPEAIRLSTPVTAIRRDGGGVTVIDAGGGNARFDHVIIAAHGDQALRMLDDPDTRETEILGAVSYAPNLAYVHRDPAHMPRRRKIWSSWNYMSDPSSGGDDKVSVTYWMNRLQNIDPSKPVFITLNPAVPPRPELTFTVLEYDHVQYDMGTLRAQRQLDRIQGPRNTWFCGAWTAHGFHEDGLRSGMMVAERLGVAAPWRIEDKPAFREAAE